MATTAKTSAAKAGTTRATKSTNAKSATNDATVAVTDEKVAASVADDVAVDMKEEPLKDSDEIEVMALIPNVSYRDHATADFYEWVDAGDVEYMTFDALTRMRRNHRGYFEDMCLKPNDKRVIKKFGLGRFYDKYDVFMDVSSYTRENVGETLNSFHSIPNAMKLSVVNKIKDMVASGEISDVNVIRTIEKRLDIDLIATL